MSRSITRPLRSLTRQAKQMAEHRLPAAVLDILETPLGDDVRVPQVEPVSVKTRDEVADVTDALNSVQESALDLAVEQAVLRRNIADSFVNLGRRNQNLLGRQLDFITELESNEADPDNHGRGAARHGRPSRTRGARRDARPADVTGWPRWWRRSWHRPAA